LAEAVDGKALAIRGRLIDGRVEVPGLSPPLHDVSGDVSVANGVLEGTHLSADFEKSHAHDGTLRIGLSGPAAPLFVDTAVGAAAADVPGLLQQLHLGDALARVSDIDGTATGTLTLNGTMADIAATVEVEQLDVSGRVQGIAQPVHVTRGHVSYARQQITTTDLQVTVGGADGVTGLVDLSYRAGALNLKRLEIKDAQSAAVIGLVLTPQELDLTFTGNLTTATVEAVVGDTHWLDGSLRGDFRTRVPLDEPLRATAEGTLHASDIVVPWRNNTQLRIASAVLTADNGSVKVDSTLEAGTDLPLQVRGTLRPSPDGIFVDLDVIAAQLVWEQLAPVLQPGSGDEEPAKAGGWTVPLRGELRIAAESLQYGRFRWQPLRATVTLAADGPVVTVTEGTLCDIATPATIAITGESLSLTCKPTAMGAQLEQTLACLGDHRKLLTGRYSLAGAITGYGRPAEIVQSLQGHVKFSAADGRLYRGGLLSKVLDVINVSLSDLTSGGMEYHSIVVDNDVRGGTLHIRRAVVDAPSMKIVGEGSIDFAGKRVDLTLLVAPLKSVDYVVSRIPIISGVLGGSLVSIPVKVSGDLSDPTVTALEPDAIGGGLLRVMKRTMKLPFKIIQPFFGGGNH
jgi:AsmA-like protein